MAFTRGSSAALLFLFSMGAHALTTNNSCDVDGFCQQDSLLDTYLICASGNWHTMPSNGYLCISGSLTPPKLLGITSSLLSSTLTTAPTSSVTPVPTESTSATLTAFGASATTTTYLSRPLSTRTTTLNGTRVIGFSSPTVDTYGIKSYIENGKMASVYDASESSTFRCNNVSYPENGLYVAFWTQYEQILQDDLESQPAPVNCGDYIEFANPLTGKSAIALVLDRCAGCIGVGKNLDDSTTPQDLVNGATVDFSRSLWDQIFNGATSNVYDILYSGKALQGAT